MTVSKTLGYDLPGGDYLEITAEERDDFGTLSAGFSVTGDLWEKSGRISGRARKRMGREQDACGMLHEEILKAAPHLKPLVDVHLAAPDGTPMHALANSWYFYSGEAARYEHAQIALGRDYGYSELLKCSDVERAAQALHIDPADVPSGLDKGAFTAFVGSLWNIHRKQAETARNLLNIMVDGHGVEA